MDTDRDLQKVANAFYKAWDAVGYKGETGYPRGQRFDVDADWPEADAAGPWVRHEDYAALEGRVAELEVLLQRWMALGRDRRVSFRYGVFEDRVWDPLFADTEKALTRVDAPAAAKRGEGDGGTV